MAKQQATTRSTVTTSQAQVRSVGVVQLGQEGAARQLTDFIFTAVCGMMLDASLLPFSLAKLTSSVDPSGSSSWAYNRPVGAQSACGAYYRLDYLHRENWRYSKYYKVIDARSVSPGDFLGTLQAGYVGPDGRGAMCVWGTIFREVAMRSRRVIAASYRLGPLRRIGAMEVCDREFLLGCIDAALRRIKQLSWDEIEQSGRLEQARIKSIRRANQSAKQVAEQERQAQSTKRTMRLQRANTLMPRFLRGLMLAGECIVPAAVKVLPPLPGLLSVAAPKVLSTYGREDQEALAELYPQLESLARGAATVAGAAPTLTSKSPKCAPLEQFRNELDDWMEA